MKIELSHTPQKPTVIIGFPGIGLVGPIVTEFLIEHMQTEQVGKFIYDNLPATAAIHKGKLIHPMSLHYSKAHNTLVLYTILNVHGKEWEVSQAILELLQKVKAKEVLIVDGANTLGEEPEHLFAFGNKTLLELGAQPLEESVITGVTGALLLLHSVSCIFAGVQANMPNAKAAARVVEFLDKHLDLQVDPKPLLEQAKLFEQKINTVIEQGKHALDEKEKRKMDYLG